MNTSSGDEQILSLVAKENFLSLWTYPNLFRDQKGNGNYGDGKELVDLAVIFDDITILFSDKRCNLHAKDYNRVEWLRFIRRTIHKSIDQLVGAERWIKSFPGRIYADRSCESHIELRWSREKSKFYRIALCHGIEGGTGGDQRGLLLHHDLSIINDLQLSNPYPSRVIGKYILDNKFFHLMNGESLLAILRDLDTISDFVSYLQFREEYFRNENNGIVAELDVISLYYDSFDAKTNVRKYEYGLQKAKRQTYERLIDDPQYEAKHKANEASLLIDGLIECFVYHYRNGTSLLENVRTVQDFEMGVFELAKLNRVERRMVANAILGFREKIGDKRGTRWLYRTDDRKYGILIFCLPAIIRGKETRDVRKKLLSNYIQIEKHDNPILEDVIAIGMESNGKIINYNKFINEGQDLVYVKFTGNHEEHIKEGGEIRKEFEEKGLISKKKAFANTEHEFPEATHTVPPSYIRIPSSLMNADCRCGSGKKFKKCCLHKLRIKT